MLQNPFVIGINQVLMQIKMKTIITEQDYEIRYVFATGNMRQFYGSVPDYSNAINPSANKVLKAVGSTYISYQTISVVNFFEKVNSVIDSVTKTCILLCAFQVSKQTLSSNPGTPNHTNPRKELFSVMTVNIPVTVRGPTFFLNSMFEMQKRTISYSFQTFNSWPRGTTRIRMHVKVQ
jgi:hypothetical protein